MKRLLLPFLAAAAIAHAAAPAKPSWTSIDASLEPGKTFGNVPLNCEVKLEVWDSPNSAGVVIDAIRCAKLALDRGIGGPLNGPASYFMKSPPIQLTDDEARRAVEEFIEANTTRSMQQANGNGRRAKRTAAKPRTPRVKAVSRS